jgi:CMP-N,N'-diacetyllegionaminic acid synthase
MRSPNIVAIIPARKGSKEIINKNIKIFNGKPLIAWTIEAAKKSKLIDKIILTTDDLKIAKIGIKYGAEVPFLRPKYLAKDNTPGIDPILHVLKKIRNVDFVLLLQPTSPLRKVIDINGIINFAIKNNFKSTVSVSNITDFPQLMYKVSSGYKLQKRFRFRNTFIRQKYEKLYRINGALYFAKVSWLIKNKSFFNEITRAYLMPKIRSIDIDNYYDWKIAKHFMKIK